MAYHSEPITRQCIAKLKIAQIASRPGVDKVAKENESKEFTENWEKLSLSSASHEERIEYFSTGEIIFKKLFGLVSLFFLMLIPLKIENQLGAAAGLLMFPLMTAFSLWIAFRVRLKRAKSSHSSPALFTTQDLIKRAALGLVYTLIIVFLLFTIMVSSDEQWV